MNGKSKWIKKCVFILADAWLCLGLTACQETPDASIVVNKNMDKLIEKAQETEYSQVSLEEM